jgi:succinoglycan biosynthesis protein ExoH
MTPLTRHEADFIAVTRLLMICGLVFHHLFEIPGSTHSPRLSVEGVEHVVPGFINAFFHMATMTAVPLLSVISGFLFFNRAGLDYPNLYARRFHSVALPTWLWSAFWLGFAYLLFMTTGDRFRWDNYGFDNPSVMTVVNGIFGVTREPFAFQFWFVRDLLLTLLLAPVIFVFLRYLGWRLLPLIGIAWLLIPDPPLFFSGNVPVFFTIGAWLTLPNAPDLRAVLTRLRALRWPLTLLFAAMLVCRVTSHAFGPGEAFLQHHVYLCLLRLVGAMTVAALVYQLVTHADELTRTLNRYSGCSFFIFAMHYPVIELVQELALLVPAHATTIGFFCSWLFVPLLTIAISIAVAVCCEKYAPGLFNLLNGGRGTASEHMQERRVAAPRGSTLTPDTP